MIEHQVKQEEPQRLTLNQTYDSQQNLINQMVFTPTDNSCGKKNMFGNMDKQDDSCSKGVKEMFSTTALLYDKTLPSDQKNATVFLKID